MILRSRIDEEQTWNGTITKIDTQNEEKSNNDMYMDDGNGTEKATKYPFYVSLESTDGLMMGQHIFIELDEGQTETKEGIWLFEGYIVQEEGEAYVWAANDRNRLEKRMVELGEYDENLGAYEITGGLTEEDAIAFPMDGLYEGVATVTDISEVDYSSPLYNQEGEEGDEMSEDGEMSDDGEMLEDGEMLDDSDITDALSDDRTEELLDGLSDGEETDGEDSSEEESVEGESDSGEAEPKESEDTDGESEE